jgi:AraC-like DNA-binding protein
LRNHYAFIDFQSKSASYIHSICCGYSQGIEKLLEEGVTHEKAYVIHYFTKGKGFFKVENGNWQNFEQDHIIIFKPGVKYFLTPQIKHSLEHYYIQFSGELPASILHDGIHKNQCLIKIKKNIMYKKIFEDIIFAAKVQSLTSYHEANALLYHLINSTMSLVNNKISEPKDTLAIESLMNYMNINIQNNKLDIESFLKDSDVSIQPYTKRFKNKYGMTINQFWITYKMNKAKSLLVNSDKNINEIADMLGYDDEFYFSRIFKKKEGVSPKSYRDSFLS